MIRHNKLSVAIAAILAAAPVAQTYAQERTSPGSDEIEEVIVSGLRGSLEAAMDIKRDAVGVVDAISAEDIGKFPDTNLAESLQRITGISIDRRNGEGSQVTARGFGAQYNLVTLNGRQIPGADGFSNGEVTIGGVGAGTRSFNFAQLASESISGVEVYKTGRADMPSGGIGATVNIKTARPFDSDGLVLNLGAKAAYDESAPFDSGVTPELSSIFSYTNDDKTWGVGLSASYQEREGGSVQSTVNAWNIQAWDGTEDAFRADARVRNAPQIGQLYGIPNDVRYAFSDFQRERINAQGVFQFAPTDALSFTLDYTLARNKIEEDRGEQTMWLQRANSFTDIEFDTNEAVATPVYLRDLVGGKDFGYEQQHNAQKNDLDSIGFNAEWQVTDRFSLALDVHNSKTESRPDDDVVRGASATFVSFAGTNCVLGACNGNWTQEMRFNNGLPLAARTFYPTQANALANTNGVPNADFAGGQLGSQWLRVWRTEQEAEVTQARIDGTLEFDDGRFQFGVDTRTVEMNRKDGFGEARLGDWGAGDAGGIPGMVSVLRPFSLTGLFDDFNAGGAAPGAWRGSATSLAQWAFASGADPITGRRYNQWNSSNTSTPNGVLAADAANDNNNTIEEDVNAVYIQMALNGELGGMATHLLLGVRYEETDVTSTSQILIPSGLLWTANNDFSVSRSSTVQPVSEETDYSHVLPSLDFDIALTETVKGRLSYSKTIARANYGDLYAGENPNNATGSVLIDQTTQASATANNPQLVPIESDNLDIAFEWYFSDNGYVSAGFWEKRVDNFIGTTSVNESLFGIRDQTSGPDAQAALAFLESAQCVAQVAPQLVDSACSANDTALFTAVAMLRNPASGGLGAYNGTTTQINAIETAYDLVAEAEDPLYQFAVQRRVNQESARIHGWEFGGQYFFGETGFGVLANYTVVRGDVSFNDTLDPALGQAQFALLGLSDTANAVLMYENFGFTARLAYNWRDEFLANTNQNGSNLNPYYVEEYEQIDLSLGYDFNDSLSVGLEAINLTGEDIRWHGRSQKQLVRLEDQSPRYALGVRYKFQ
jgi:TonB-dependent receptor